MSHKYWVALLILICSICSKALPQNRHLFRLYEDNDFINIAGDGTDKGYTNGTRLDYFFQKKHPNRFFLDNWFPRAGIGSVNTFNYSIMQVMLVPNDITRLQPDKNDWPYSGSLVLSHGLCSSNPVKKFAFFTEITAGVIGPWAFAKETQTWIHRVIGYNKPMGWGNQMPNDILLNIDMQAEKMIWQPGKAFELMGGGQAQIGTMLDGASIHIQLRVGDMQPYFNGYIEQFASYKGMGHRRLQYYLLIKPAVQWWTYNALLQGGIFSGKSKYYAGIDSKGASPSLKEITATIDAGIVLVMGNVSLSFMQRELSPLLHGVSDQTIGNISITFGW
jgi:hypothetical protein